MNTKLFLSLSLLLLAAAPVGIAHDPPGPVLTCQRGDDLDYHDYLPPSSGIDAVAGDGNLENCGYDGFVGAPDRVCRTAALAFSDALSPLCDGADFGIERPVADYDGELDHGYGGAVLFVRTGDGVTDGVSACYGAASFGHHTSAIRYQDLAVGGSLYVTIASDHSLAPAGSPDCGDDYVQPCETPREPSDEPFPANVAADLASRTLDFATNSPGLTCNPLDAVRLCEPPLEPSSWYGACDARFDPGADGTYRVYVCMFCTSATLGHIWTEAVEPISPPDP